MTETAEVANCTICGRVATTRVGEWLKHIDIDEETDVCQNCKRNVNEKFANAGFTTDIDQFRTLGQKIIDATQQKITNEDLQDFANLKHNLIVDWNNLIKNLMDQENYIEDNRWGWLKCNII